MKTMFTLRSLCLSLQFKNWCYSPASRKMLISFRMNCQNSKFSLDCQQPQWFTYSTTPMSLHLYHQTHGAKDFSKHAQMNFTVPFSAVMSLYNTFAYLAYLCKSCEFTTHFAYSTMRCGELGSTNSNLWWKHEHSQQSDTSKAPSSYSNQERASSEAVSN